MRKVILSFLMVLAFWGSAHAYIVETKNAKDIIAEVDSDTLVLFDIDQTTLYPSTMLGSPAWWDYFTKMLTATTDGDFPIRSFLNPLISTILRNVPHTPVEAETPELIRSLQNQGITVFALTGRFRVAPWDPHFGHHTRDQLHTHDIDFTRSSSPEGVVLEPHTTPDTFAHGIIFTSWQDKGVVLKEFLNTVGHRPAKVILIDDMLSFLLGVDTALTDMGIPFVGFHYTRLAEHDSRFDPMIANIQAEWIIEKNTVLTDEEAQKIKMELLALDPTLSPDFFMEKLISKLNEQFKSNEGGSHGTTTR